MWCKLAKKPAQPDQSKHLQHNTAKLGTEVYRENIALQIQQILFCFLLSGFFFFFKYGYKYFFQFNNVNIRGFLLIMLSFTFSGI